MLQHFLITELFAFLLIFCRIGSGMMVMPGIGEGYVSPIFRLSIAVAITLVMVPVISTMLPPPPTTPFTLFVLVTTEILAGLFIGVVVRIILSATHTAGMILSMQSGLSAAMLFDATQASQGSIIGNLLGLMTVVLFFVTDLHHVMLRGLFDSYTLFPAGQTVSVGDMTDLVTQYVDRAFIIAVKISIPLLAVGLLMYLSAGVLSRLMPTMQVFFVLMAPQLLLSFFIIMVVLSSVMLWYLTYMHDAIAGFLEP